MNYKERSIYFTMDLSDEMFNPLTSEEELALLKRYKEDNDVEAKHELIIRNLKFVNNMVRTKFASLISASHRFDAQTLFQEGVIGLMEALDMFDMSKNVKFLTYASYRINKAIWLYVYGNSSSMSGCMSLYRDYNRIVNILKREPNLTYEDISKKIKGFRSAQGIKNIMEYMESKQASMIYDHSVTSDGEEYSLIEISSSTTMDEEINEILYNEELRDIINKMLDDKAIFVNKKSRTYFEEYYLNGLSYREVAEKYGVTHQAVQQSVQKRMDYIKRNYSHVFEEYYNC